MNEQAIGMKATMTAKATRKIVQIDEAKCDGCGLCIPNCAEGALRIINGKAKLVAENLCDGLGACLGHCPRGAIVIEERAADEFDHHAVDRHLQQQKAAAAMTFAATEQTASLNPGMPAHHSHGGCPGSRMRMLRPSSHLQPTGPMPAPRPADDQPSRPSQLGQWPVQLALVPTTGPMWQNAHVLIAADCVPFACPEFHEKMLAGKSLAIACPKLDDIRPYVQKLATIFAGNSIQSITVAHMEVPCCSGIVRAVQMALIQAGRDDIPVHDITVGIDGTIRATVP